MVGTSNATDVRSDPVAEPADLLLYRVVNQAELDAIRAAGFSSLPVPPEWQPLVYLSSDATEAFRSVRPADPREAGAQVVRLRVRSDVIAPYRVRWVGGSTHYRIPAEVVGAVNDGLIGAIELVDGPSQLPRTPTLPGDGGPGTTGT